MDDLELHQTSEGLVATIAGSEIFTYVTNTDHIPAGDTPKPYFHPVRNLAGDVLTDFAPDDHPWHHGISIAYPRVNDHNLWGGGTYLGPEKGYVIPDDHGFIRHHAWNEINAEAGIFSHELKWYGKDESLLITESRSWRVTVLGSRGWQLSLHTVLRNEASAELKLETPQQRGRADGGYGGLFFRMSAGLSDFAIAAGGLPVSSSGASGNDFVLQAQMPEGRRSTIVMQYASGVPENRQKWLYRTDPFPLAGFAVAYDDGVVIAPSGVFEFSHRIGILNGRIDSKTAVEALVRV